MKVKYTEKYRQILHNQPVRVLKFQDEKRDSIFMAHLNIYIEDKAF